MAEPFLSEIRIMSFGFAPKGWALCNGQTLPINQNQALFALLGTTYGGDGRTTFALPDLRGRTPIHQGAGHSLGERAGEASHTLSASELPTHTHGLSATSATDSPQPVPTNAYLAPTASLYGPAAALTTLTPGTVTSVGGGQAHPNMQPFLTLNCCIALQGIFPSQS
jgi:microcystin-dependent protein